MVSRRWHPGQHSAVASGLTFVVAGFIATLLSWRASFGLITVISAVFIIASPQAPLPARPASASISSGRSVGAGHCLHPLASTTWNTWGLVLAKAAAPSPVWPVAGALSDRAASCLARLLSG